MRTLSLDQRAEIFQAYFSMHVHGLEPLLRNYHSQITYIAKVDRVHMDLDPPVCLLDGLHLFAIYKDAEDGGSPLRWVPLHRQNHPPA